LRLSKKPGLQWLAPYFDACLLLATPTQTEIGAGLKRLASKGLLTLSGTNYLPGELVQQMIAEFLIVDGHIEEADQSTISIKIGPERLL